MAPAAEKQRKTQDRSLKTRERLVQAAVHEFADKGFDGASTREIAARADLAQSSVPYHFRTKEMLWKAAADHLFGLLRERLESRLEGLRGVDSVTTARLLLGEFVRFAAENPELHRFALQEGTGTSARLEWLVATHVAGMGALVQRILQGIAEAGGAGLGPPGQVFYVLIGAVSTPYALAPQVRLTTGEDAFSEDFVEAHTELLLRLFMPAPPSTEEG